MQIAVGLQRLGHDVYYFETTSDWPYDPTLGTKVNNSSHALSYLEKVANSFGFDGLWAYRRSYSDNAWFGMNQTEAEALLLHADAVLNIAGATRLSGEGLKVGRLVYIGTDPVYQEIAYANGDENIGSLIREHDDCITYGENIGTPDNPIPPLPRLRGRTRQPILMDQWQNDLPARNTFTTVCNWKQTGHDIEYRGKTYFWSKHHEFLKFIDLPKRIDQPIELATGFSNLSVDEQNILTSNGWKLTDSFLFTTDPWAYREYVLGSRGEFTVAKDQNVRLRSGWFSERSACYLAAGRPVITQNTGFGSSVPTGKGLFAFDTIEDIFLAFEAINSDYEHHSRAARSIAEEYFSAETVLSKVLHDLGL